MAILHYLFNANFLMKNSTFCTLFFQQYPHFLHPPDVYVPELDTSLPSYEQAIQLVSSSHIHRVQALEGIHRVNQLSEQFKTYLKPFAEQKKVVTAQDVYAFFDSLKK
ncbi:hypothetical protein HMI54_015554 [Coelomomyces lativittatus]|nr:hypothetical protein HMI54_015554 [Coelomomyces lativittatus]